MVCVKYNTDQGTTKQVFKTIKQARLFCYHELGNTGYEMYFVKNNFKTRG